MSTEGVALLSRVALAAVLIITTAFVRVLIGPSKRRGFLMGIGTLGGMATGVAVASLTSQWIATDLSVTFACLGIFAGWIVAWRFVRHPARGALNLLRAAQLAGMLAGHGPGLSHPDPLFVNSKLTD